MTKPAYLRKFRRASVKGRPLPEAAFLAFLESLNEPDWEGLIADIITQTAEAFAVFLPPRGEDLLSYSASFLERLGLQAQSIAGRGLERVVNQSIRRRDGQLLSGGLYIASALQNPVTVEFLLRLVRDRSVDDQIREEAADALSNFPEAVPLSFWTSIDLQRDPFLLPSVLASLCQLRPTEALSVLEKASHAITPESVEYPLRILVRTLARSEEGQAKLQSAYERASNEIRSLLRRVFELPEFGEVSKSWINDAIVNETALVVTTRQTSPFDFGGAAILPPTWASELVGSLSDSGQAAAAPTKRLFLLPFVAPNLPPEFIPDCIEDYITTGELGPFDQRPELEDYLARAFQMLDGLPRVPVAEKIGQAIGSVRCREKISGESRNAFQRGMLKATALDPPSRNESLPLHALRIEAKYLANKSWRLTDAEFLRGLYEFANVDLAELATHVREAAEKCQIRELINAVSEFHEDQFFAVAIGALLKRSKFFGWVNEHRGWGSLHTSHRGEADVGFRNDAVMSPSERKFGTPVYEFQGYNIFARREWLERILEEPHLPEGVLDEGNWLLGQGKEAAEKNLPALAWLTLKGGAHVGFPEVLGALQQQAKGLNGISRHVTIPGRHNYDQELERFLKGALNVFIGGAVHARLLKRWWSSLSHEVVELMEAADIQAIMGQRRPQNRLFFKGQFNAPPMRAGDPRKALQQALSKLYLEVGRAFNNAAAAYGSNELAQPVIDHLSAIALSEEPAVGDGKWAFVSDPKDTVGLLTEDDKFLSSTRAHR